MKRARLHTTDVPHSVFLRRIKTGVDRAQALKKSMKREVTHKKKEVAKQPVVAEMPVSLWKFEKAQSSIEFSAMYFKVVNIGGRFNNFDLRISSAAEDFGDAVIELIIRVDSLDTGNTERDELLKSEEWLNAAKYPAINFNSTSFKKIENKKYELTGNVTIHGISHTVTLEVMLNGVFTNTYPRKTIAGFTVRGMFNRRKFEVGEEAEATGVSDEIEIGANIEITKE